MTFRRLRGSGRAELAAVLRECRPLLIVAGLFSALVNLLMLTGPIYMLQIYDRVLSSRSEETLVALTLLAAFLFAVMAVLDTARFRVLARVGAKVQARLDARAFAVSVSGAPDGATARTDLDTLKSAFASPAIGTVFDLPWVPMFLALMFVFHPLMGWLALGGGTLLLVLAALAQRAQRRPGAEHHDALCEAEQVVTGLSRDPDGARGLAMQEGSKSQWLRFRSTGLCAGLTASDRAAAGFGATRALRLFLQSASLGLGGWLVLRGEITAGGMIAASILLGRALAPLDTATAHWPVASRALAAARRLGKALDLQDADLTHRTSCADGSGLRVDKVTIVPPGRSRAAIRMASFEAAPGQVIAIDGPSGCGKTAMARALTGTWPIAAGCIRYGSRSLERIGPEERRATLGYMPQRVALHRGTLAQNIACFSPDADPDAIITAARLAGLHQVIVDLPGGYDAQIGADLLGLSVGETRRIGLARALYATPRVIILDAPAEAFDDAARRELCPAVQSLAQIGSAVVAFDPGPELRKICDRHLRIENGILRDATERAPVDRPIRFMPHQIGGAA